MKTIVLLTALTLVLIGAACGSKTETLAGNKPADNKSSAASNSAVPTAMPNSAAAVVKEVYDDAMRRNCSAISPKLTEEFRNAVGTSKDALEALCDTFTDSGKLAGFEIKGEELKGDSGKIKVALTYKDGKKEEKSENVKKSGDRWLLDS